MKLISLDWDAHFKCRMRWEYSESFRPVMKLKFDGLGDTMLLLNSKSMAPFCEIEPCKAIRGYDSDAPLAQFEYRTFPDWTPASMGRNEAMPIWEYGVISAYFKQNQWHYGSAPVRRQFFTGNYGGVSINGIHWSQEMKDMDKLIEWAVDAAVEVLCSPEIHYQTILLNEQAQVEKLQKSIARREKKMVEARVGVGLCGGSPVF